YRIRTRDLKFHTLSHSCVCSTILSHHSSSVLLNATISIATFITTFIDITNNHHLSYNELIYRIKTLTFILTLRLRRKLLVSIFLSLMKVLYHPRNYYLIHVDYGTVEVEHRDVVMGKPNLVTYRGPTMLATTLNAMAMLLKTYQ
ncbi:Beta-glucuronosyltransferase GlcAT14C, partial [Mucuna pruriens]